MLDTENNIVGRTTNPHNTALSPGGSSGGESALLALNGSLLGVGSDIGIFQIPYPFFLIILIVIRWQH